MEEMNKDDRIDALGYVHPWMMGKPKKEIFPMLLKAINTACLITITVCAVLSFSYIAGIHFLLETQTAWMLEEEDYEDFIPIHNPLAQEIGWEVHDPNKLCQMDVCLEMKYINNRVDALWGDHHRIRSEHYGTAKAGNAPIEIRPRRF